ncbi:hypothetical protein Cgig2_029709 [Carnegiea gigantea]|uniref:Uncharacterized protein n=1 Tax=Carnegiea gigantea TaxID=171969 RepID=A0A9Q1KH82_9CARY|nr:hypothetical protein Cgig2_029709 [Carnegiea gigantea]
MWEDSSGSEYEAHSEKEQGHDYECSLEAKSDVDENMGEGDGGPIISCDRANRRPSYFGVEDHGGGERRRRGGLPTAFKQGRAIELKGDEVSTDAGNMVRERMCGFVSIPQGLQIRTSGGSPVLEVRPELTMGRGWLSVDERLRRARDTYQSKKIAHESTKNEGVADKAVKPSEATVCGVPAGIERDVEVGHVLRRKDRGGGMGLNGSHVHDGEEGHISSADACIPVVHGEYESMRASIIVVKPTYVWMGSKGVHDGEESMELISEEVTFTNNYEGVLRKGFVVDDDPNFRV